jgi:hypothetical protein
MFIDKLNFNILSHIDYYKEILYCFDLLYTIRSLRKCHRLDYTYTIDRYIMSINSKGTYYRSIWELKFKQLNKRSYENRW